MSCCVCAVVELKLRQSVARKGMRQDDIVGPPREHGTLHDVALDIPFGASRQVEKWRAATPTAVIVASDYPLIHTPGDRPVHRTRTFISVYDPPLFSSDPDLHLAAHRLSEQDYFLQRRRSYGASPGHYDASKPAPDAASAQAGRFAGLVVRFLLLPVLSILYLLLRRIQDSTIHAIEAGRVFLAVDDASRIELLFHADKSLAASACIGLWRICVAPALSVLSGAPSALNAVLGAPAALARAVVRRVEERDGPWREFVDPLVYGETLGDKLGGAWRAWERFAWKDL